MALLLSLIIQFIITAFETVIILQLKGSVEFTVSFIGLSLLVCGLVMAVFQPIVAKWGHLLIKGFNKQIIVGFLASGIVLTLFVFVQSRWLILLTIGLFGLGTFLPGLAVGARRLHDIDKSGWYLLLWLLPVIGWIWLLVLALQRGTDGPNGHD